MLIALTMVIWLSVFQLELGLSLIPDPEPSSENVDFGSSRPADYNQHQFYAGQTTHPEMSSKKKKKTPDDLPEKNKNHNRFANRFVVLSLGDEDDGHVYSPVSPD